LDAAAQSGDVDQIKCHIVRGTDLHVAHNPAM
jgi:hypothetical protein